MEIFHHKKYENNDWIAFYKTFNSHESIESVPESIESVPESIESSQYRETLISRNFKSKDDHQLSESEINQLVSKSY